MGMDVYGKAPTSETGKYFRRSVWGWHPLWEFCESVYAPCKKVLGHSNDGDGLNAQQARELAEVLEMQLKNGQVEAHVTIRNAELSRLPNEQCSICSGTGKRNWDTDPHLQAERKRLNKHGEFPCNACEGNGWKRPFETWYRLDKQDIEEFIVFLRDSGGFEIC